MKKTTSRCFAALLGLVMTSATPHATLAQAQAPIERLFISGHSLTDPPMPRHLALIARSLGTPMQWNMQSLPGSPIHMRTRGTGGTPGWRQGTNREGSGLDVLEEWRTPSTVQGGLYDALLVAEQHGVLGALTWHDTVTTLREVHDAFVQRNPKGRTWFYEAWLDVDDRNNPERWIAYERAASRTWVCIAARVNQDLARATRNDRIQSLPSGAALAHLVERATTAGVAGISAGSTRATIDRLFADDVHLTALGHYYMAAVVYALIWGRSPEGADAPEGIDAQAARSSQREAWAFASIPANQTAAAPSLASCREHLSSRFIAQHWGYVRDTTWRREHGTLGAWWRWLKISVPWHLRIRRSGPDNPFAD